MKTYTVIKETRDHFGDVIDSESLKTYKRKSNAIKTAAILNDEETDDKITYCLLIEHYIHGCIEGFEYIEHDEL